MSLLHDQLRDPHRARHASQRYTVPCILPHFRDASVPPSVFPMGFSPRVATYDYIVRVIASKHMVCWCVLPNLFNPSYPVDLCVPPRPLLVCMGISELRLSLRPLPSLPNATLARAYRRRVSRQSRSFLGILLVLDIIGGTTSEIETSVQ